MKNYELIIPNNDEEIMECGEAMKIALSKKYLIEFYRQTYDQLGFVKKDGQYYMAIGAKDGVIKHAVLYANGFLSTEDVEVLRELATERGLKINHPEKTARAVSKALHDAS